MPRQSSMQAYWDSFVRRMQRLWDVFLSNVQSLSRRLGLTQNQGLATLGLVAVLSCMLFWGIWPLRRQRRWENVLEYGRWRRRELTIFTPSELQRFDGSRAGRPMYLSIIGDVYDVTAGSKYYGGSTKYSALLGRDASKPFATGRFLQSDLGQSLSGCSADELAEAFAWRDFFRTQKKYPKVGILHGRYYNSLGWSTFYLYYLELMSARARDSQDRRSVGYHQYDPCSSSATEGPTVETWCPPGKYIRELVTTHADGREARRCVCAHEGQFLNVGLAPYADCGPAAQRCDRHK